MADLYNLADRAAIKRANDAPKLEPPRELWVVLQPRPFTMKVLEPTYATEVREEAMEYANNGAETKPDHGPYVVRKYALSEKKPPEGG